jgi:hypothetical protein
VIICENLCPIKDSQIIDVPFFTSNEVVVDRNAISLPAHVVKRQVVGLCFQNKLSIRFFGLIKIYLQLKCLIFPAVAFSLKDDKSEEVLLILILI